MKKGAKRRKPNTKTSNRRRSNPSSEKGFKEGDLSLELEDLIDHQEREILGGGRTHLAFKNESTYVMATDRYGLKLIANDSEIYSAELPSPDCLKGLVYAEHPDCFFFTLDGRVYRIDINNQPPFVFLDSIDGENSLNCINYSKTHKKLILTTEHNQLVLMDLVDGRDRVEFVADIGGENFIQNFKIFGQRENRLITVASTGDLSLHVIGYKRKKVLSSNHLQIELEEENEESVVPGSLAVSDGNDHIIIELQKATEEFFSCSRTIVLKVTNNGSILAQKAVLVVNDQETPVKDSRACCGCFGSQILWIGVGAQEHGYEVSIRVFDYNSETESLKEIEEKSFSHEENVPMEIHRLGDNFYYIGFEGKLMRLKVSYQS